MILSAAALADDGVPSAWRKRAANFRRAGWVVVDGRFAKPQAELKTDELFRLDTAGRFSLVARPAPRVEPLLKNYRTSLVTLAGSEFAFTLACAGRTWNDTRSAGTQHLTLSAIEDRLTAVDTMRLTRVEITPVQQVVQGVVTENDDVVSVIVVFGRDFVEAAAGPFGRPPAVLVRSPDAHTLAREHPIETRRYVTPLLKLLTGGANPLAPGAADVYRAFPDLPTDARAAAAVAAQGAGLASPDPAARQRASDALALLGPRGVQAAMRVDRAKLSPEAADRLAALIAAASFDPRPAEALRADPNFRLDCLDDADPNVRARRGGRWRRRRESPPGAWIGRQRERRRGSHPASDPAGYDRPMDTPRPTVTSADTRRGDPHRRTPPGQTLTAKWPVLHYGKVPRVDPHAPDWRLRVFGRCENEYELTYDDIRRMPAVDVVCDMHCVTHWEPFGQPLHRRARSGP